ncbi:MAG: hypothetical protein F6K37_18105, partial [Moorea sp. SIO4E2]|uniref:hypothetical protein n=1 Tax=Moorena sp. SIO4E2 TaxID=2607826 RepID=UPI0013B66221
MVKQPYWWNSHIAGTGILVEQPSWWNGHLGETAILVEQPSWWNGHLARFMFIRPLSNASLFTSNFSSEVAATGTDSECC